LQRKQNREFDFSSGHMTDLFNAIVELFNTICRITGAPYHELNILIYCFLIPATWWVIVWFRTRLLTGFELSHMALPLYHYVQTAQSSERFYNANVAALFYLGGNTNDGYIKISIVAGLIFPVLIYLGLFQIPKRWLVQSYFVLIFLNMGWYVWALSRF